MSASLFGQLVPYKEYEWDSTKFNHLVEPDYDAASEHGFWPMSERQYNNLLPVRGFRERNGGNYGGYVKEWFDSRPVAPDGADEAIYHMFKARREALSAGESDEDTVTAELGYAKRCVDLARELYGWARSAAWAAKNGVSELVVFDALEYHEPWLSEDDYLNRRKVEHQTRKRRASEEATDAAEDEARARRARFE